MKDNLRTQLKYARKNFGGAEREKADGIIAERLLSAFADMRSFFVYCSYGSEADTRYIIKALLAAGKDVYLPRVEGRDMAAVPYDGNGALVRSAMGIMEPEGGAFAGDVDVVIAPLLAVSSWGYRLGYGGGYYDRYLARHTRSLKAGMGYAFQLVGEQFQEEGDVPLDCFVNERGILCFTDRAKAQIARNKVLGQSGKE